MKHVYAPTYLAIKTAQVLETAVLEGRDFVEAQVKLASTANAAYDRIRAAATQLPVTAGLTTKEAMVVRVVDVALSIHDTHLDTGAKVAAAPDALAAVLQKLATAVFVDEVLTEQMCMLEGETKVAAAQCQLLGREYVMSLIAELLG